MKKTAKKKATKQTATKKKATGKKTAKKKPARQRHGGELRKLSSFNANNLGPGIYIGKALTIGVWDSKTCALRNYVPEENERELVWFKEPGVVLLTKFTASGARVPDSLACRNSTKQVYAIEYESKGKNFAHIFGSRPTWARCIEAAGVFVGTDFDARKGFIG